MRHFEAAEKEASGTRKGSEAAFRMDLRPDFRWPRAEVAGKERDEQRRSIGAERGEDQILGGSDPTLSGFSAAQRHGRRGSLPPNLSSRVPRFVAGRVVSRQPDKIGSHES